MITIVYMQCSKEFDDNICNYLDKLCPGIELCISVPNIVASWQELVLAFINTVDAIRNKKNVARKPELEFYIRFFANRQIHVVLSNYLAEYKPYANFKIALIYHDSQSLTCVETNIGRYLTNNPYCEYLSKPESEELYKLYLKLIRNIIGLNSDTHIDKDKAHKIIIGIAGCGALLIKD